LVECDVVMLPAVGMDRALVPLLRDEPLNAQALLFCSLQPAALRLLPRDSPSPSSPRFPLVGSN
jgi:hypothetical protein